MSSGFGTLVTNDIELEPSDNEGSCCFNESVELDNICETTSSNDFQSCMELIENKSNLNHFKFVMDEDVSGEGFINVANNFFIHALIYVYTGNTELKTREHGSGTFENTEQARLMAENNSIEISKDVSAIYSPINFDLPFNRSLNYSSRWNQDTCVKTWSNPAFVGAKGSNVYHYPSCRYVKMIGPENLIGFSSPEDACAHGYRPCEVCNPPEPNVSCESLNEICSCKLTEPKSVAGVSMGESYLYATSIDRNTRIKFDENVSYLSIDSQFEGMGHIGTVKKYNPNFAAYRSPIFESDEDYRGSFRIIEDLNESDSGFNSIKYANGTGYVNVDKRIRENQRSYEYGTGTYKVDEVIGTRTSYMSKDIGAIYSMSNESLSPYTWINQSLPWKEGMWIGNNRYTNFITEEITDAGYINAEIELNGLSELRTVANFSGTGKYRTVLEDQVDLYDMYAGNYTIAYDLLLTGIPRYSESHVSLNVFGAFENNTTIVRSRITIINDGNRALGPVYVKDIFPSGAVYLDASVRPEELTTTYAKWALTYLSIGEEYTIDLRFNIAEYRGELVNTVEVNSGYDNNLISTSSSSIIEPIGPFGSIIEPVSKITTLESVDSPICEVDNALTWGGWDPPDWDFKYPENLSEKSCEELCEYIPLDDV